MPAPTEPIGSIPRPAAPMVVTSPAVPAPMTTRV